MGYAETGPDPAESGRCMRENPQRLRSEIKAEYDYVVCDAGSSGSVVAQRFAEDPGCNVLMLKTGGDDDVANVTDAGMWATNIDSERDWAFPDDPRPH